MDVLSSSEVITDPASDVLDQAPASDVLDQAPITVTLADGKSYELNCPIAALMHLKRQGVNLLGGYQPLECLDGVIVALAGTYSMDPQTHLAVVTVPDGLDASQIQSMKAFNIVLLQRAVTQVVKRDCIQPLLSMVEKKDLDPNAIEAMSQ